MFHSFASISHFKCSNTSIDTVSVFENTFVPGAVWGPNYAKQ